MSTILNALTHTLCLHRSGSGTKIAESRHKLEGTYVYFQGEPIEISHISNTEGFHYHKMDGRSYRFPFDAPCGDDAIQVFNLDSGIYMCNGVPVEIMRRVNKTYKKSFYPDAYTYLCLDSSEGAMRQFHRDFSYFSLLNLKRQTIYTYKNHIFYWRKSVGRILPDKTLDVNRLFTNEVREALENGTIKI